MYWSWASETWKGRLEIESDSRWTEAIEMTILKTNKKTNEVPSQQGIKNLCKAQFRIKKNPREKYTDKW